MKEKKKISIIGGDLRQIKMAEQLVEKGYDVKIFGFTGVKFNENILNADNIKEAVKNVDVIITPLPCSQDDETINAFFYNKKIYFNDLFKEISKNQLLVGGRVSEKISNLAKVYNTYIIDYFAREELNILNAIPTAEGAVQIAMEELPITLHNSKCLVLGFGRIGKVLSKILYGIGARVSVGVRKYEDLAWVKAYNYKGIHTNNLKYITREYDLIFNTVPCKIIDKQVLENLKKDCLIIDLASKPGGVDYAIAKEMGIKVIWALSLPGKVAPVTAGNIIIETIFNIINELGV